MNPQEFPSNSKNPKPAEQKNIERVVHSEVVARKKSLGKRFKEVLIGGDSRSVFGYVLMEVVVPQVKDMISEAASQGIERMVYGDNRGTHRRYGPRPASTNHTNYNRYSGRGNNPIGRSMREDRPTASVRSQEIDDMLFATRVEADEALTRLYDLLNEYGMVSIADLYAVIGWTSTHTHQKWGWETLHGSSIQRVRDGYILNLPKPEFLD